MCKDFKRSRMCEEEAKLWAQSYLRRVLENPLTFDPDYSILYSYPEEVIKILSKWYSSVPAPPMANTKQLDNQTMIAKKILEKIGCH